jgi:hypothetical protein
MTPGNIAMLVDETPGARVQVTSPALGAANVSVQGRKGGYTQILAHGLPQWVPRDGRTIMDGVRVGFGAR